MKRIGEKMADRRARILETAREIVAERGFEGLTIRALARAAGVTAPTIYNLIGNKEEVLVAAVAEQTERFVQGLGRASGDVVAIVDANLRELLRMPRYYRSLMRLLLTSDAAAIARHTVSLGLRGQLAAALGELEEAGSLEDWIDRESLVGQIQSLLGATSLAWANGWISDDDLVAQERLGIAYLMLGATRGPVRDTYLRLLRENQPPRLDSQPTAATKRRRRM